MKKYRVTEEQLKKLIEITQRCHNTELDPIGSAAYKSCLSDPIEDLTSSAVNATHCCGKEIVSIIYERWDAEREQWRQAVTQALDQRDKKDDQCKVIAKENMKLLENLSKPCGNCGYTSHHDM